MIDRRTLLKSSTVALGDALFGTGAGAKTRSSDTIPAHVGGYTYRLPRFKKASRLLFQGDSITDMKWGRNQEDRNHYLGHSYVYLIAARLGVDRPEAQLDIYNRGISGNAVGDLRRRWEKDTLALKPDLLSVLVGINDVNRNLDGVDVKTWEADYRFILDASRKVNPDLRLVLLDPFVLASGRLSAPEPFKKWRAQVERLIPIVGQLANDYQAVHIKTQAVFDAAAIAVSPEHWIWDGVHPLPQGHELIARHWLQEVSARWGEA